MEMKFTVSNRKFKIGDKVINLRRPIAIGEMAGFEIEIKYSESSYDKTNTDTLSPKESISGWIYDVRILPRYHSMVNESLLISVDELKAEIAKVGNLQTAANHELDLKQMLALIEGKIDMEKLERWVTGR